VTRTILIAGLIMLAALLPLALPPTIFVLEVPFAALGAAPPAGATAQPPALLRLTVSRAPPSR